MTVFKCQDLPPAHQVLVACLDDTDERLRAALERCVAAGADLPFVAAVHGLPPLLYRRLRDSGLDRMLPAGQWEALRRRYLRGAQRQEAMLAMAGEVAGLLADAQVPCVALKGLAAAATAGSTLLPREMVDLDLLVPPDEIVRATELLVAHGYAQARYPWAPTPWEYHLPRLEKRGLPLEMHWRLWPRGPLQPFSLPGAGTLLAEGVPGHTSGVPLVVPALPWQIIVTVGGMAVDGLAVFLRQWADLKRLWQQLTPEEEGRLWAVAEQCRMRRYLQMMLGLARELWPGMRRPAAAEGPDQALECLRPVAWRRLAGAPVRRASFWMLLTVRRMQGAGLLREPEWREHLPPQVRPKAVQRASGGAVAQTGGALVAAGRLLSRTGRWLVDRRERQALAEELLVSRVLAELAE